MSEIKTPNELKKASKSLGISLTNEEAKEYFNILHEKGKLTSDELLDISGGGCTKWRKGKAYSGNGRHCLIVVSGFNSCNKWERRDNCFESAKDCSSCKHEFSSGITHYCEIRTYDNDPLNPK